MLSLKSNSFIFFCHQSMYKIVVDLHTECLENEIQIVIFMLFVCLLLGLSALYVHVYSFSISHNTFSLHKNLR